MATKLDTMTFPLHGARLIEASAGTGKTFTIAGLYLRLLLGHGDATSRHSTPLTVDQILVVTFTEAATAELRDRIRSRIHQARIAFLRHESSDPVIEPLLEQVKDHSWAASVLLNAERSMDEAAVFTIHGFCQRMLTQNAFESGSRFNNEFVTDETKLKAQVVCDYWRNSFYLLPKPLASEIRNLWQSPEALLNAVGQYLTGVPVKLTVKAMSGSLEQLHQENLEVIAQIKRDWLESSPDIAHIINDSDVSKRSFTKKNLPSWIKDVDLWAKSETNDYRIPDKLDKFSQDFLTEKTPENKKIPSHAIFQSIANFFANKPSIKEPVIAHAIEVCRSKLAETKKEKQWLSFDDLLTQLSVAIDQDESAVLTDRIRQLFPVAMIDEFQDTDPLQYSIFSRIYLENPETGLFMIGDPKQAIYAFRGADIFTYIRARNEVTDHYTLGTNWRSAQDMVESVNQLFNHSNSPFLYDEDIPFLPVSASKGAEHRCWWYDGKAQKALSFWLMESDVPLAKKDYLEQMSRSTAVKIKLILESAKKNKAYFCSGGQATQKPIEARDIAVLVRTGAEARLVKQELAKLNVSSVYLSNRDSVFVSPIADAILRILQAVINPEDESALRAALASHLLCKTSAELDELNVSESKLEEQIYQFQEYHKIWKQRGVMPMLRTVMARQNIAQSLLVQEFGERQITDYLHLCELLQQASLTVDSEYALLRWFGEQTQQAQRGESGVLDEQIQRLESEKHLVQIVTIHKSKGLEYDLVFLPFLSSYREAQLGKFYDDQQQQTILDITENADSIKKADRERLAEDLRLLYVAITRAVYGCFIGLAPLRKGRSRKDPSSADLCGIGYLIQNGKSLGSTDLKIQLDKLLAINSAIMSIEPFPEPIDLQEQIGLFEHGDLFSNNDALEHHELKDHHDLKASQLKRQIDRNWRMTSYSALAKQGHGSSHKSQQEPVIDSQGLDVDAVTEASPEELEEAVPSIFTFPKGARAGTFLHTLFEEIDFTHSASCDETTQVISQLLESEQYDADWLSVLQDLVDNVLNASLMKGLQLSSKASHQKLVEMEFLLPIQFLSSTQLDLLTKKHDDLSQVAGELGFNVVQGMLKGFIDLIFEHEGKFYVLDWKSNYLGDNPSHYSESALNEAMIEHRYDLQYQIYSLALHRFLRSRKADYNYEEHFGGVYYLFLRGIEKESQNGIFFKRPSEAFLVDFDRLIDGHGEESSHV